MLYLLLGTDQFSKKTFLAELKEKEKAEVIYSEFSQSGLAQALNSASDLFGKKGIFVFTELDSGLLEKKLDDLIRSSAILIISVTSLDKRLNATKTLLSNKKINVKEFVAPSGSALETWIADRVALKHCKITHQAVKLLMSRLGLATKGFAWDQKPADLNAIDTELDKLIAYSGGQEVNEEAVQALIPDSTDTKVFEIIDTLGTGQKKLTIGAVDAFFTQPDGIDEKTKAIQLGALLADQFRSILLIKSYIEHGVPEKDIIARSGFKPGRVAIMRKLIPKFETKILLTTLKKLASFDEELKSSTVPPRVMLNMIIAQL